jgi:hypothetical protein
VRRVVPEGVGDRAEEGLQVGSAMNIPHDMGYSTKNASGVQLASAGAWTTAICTAPRGFRPSAPPFHGLIASAFVVVGTAPIDSIITRPTTGTESPLNMLRAINEPNSASPDTPLIRLRTGGGLLD